MVRARRSGSQCELRDRARRRRIVPRLGHYCAATCCAYASAVISSSSSALSFASTSIIQPLPYGSALTSSGESLSEALTAMTRPETGAYRSLTLFTLSTVPNRCPLVTYWLPLGGR